MGTPDFQPNDIASKPFCQDDNIETFIEQQGNMLDILTDKSCQLLSENDELRNRLEQNIIELPSARRSVDKENREQVNLSCALDEINCNNKIDDLKEENELLLQQSSLLVKEIDNANKSISIRDKQIVTFNDEAGKKLQLIKQYQQRIKKLITQKNSCEQLLVRKVDELNIAKNEVISMKKHQERHCSQKSELTAKLDSLKEDREEFNRESQHLVDKLKLSVARITELDSINIKQSEEIESLRNKLRKMERKEMDSEIISKLMLDNDFQIKSLLQKENELSKSVAQQRIRAEESILAREQIDASCSTLKDELKRIYSSREKEAENNVRERQNIINELKKQYAKDIQSRDKLINEMNLQIANITIERDRHDRDRESIDCNYNKLKIRMNTEQDEVKAHIAQLSKELSDVKRKYKADTLLRQELDQDKSNLQRRVQSLELELKKIIAENEKNKEDLEIDIAKTKDQNQKLSSALDDLQIEGEKVILQFEKKIKKLNEDSGTRTQELEEENEMIKCKLTEVEKSVLSYCKLIDEQAEQHKSEIAKFDDESKKVIFDLENKLSEEREVGQRLMNRNQELTEKYQSISKEKLEYQNRVFESELKSDQMEQCLKNADNKLSFLGKQLSASINEQHKRIQSERSLRSELRQIKLEQDLQKISSLDDENLSSMRFDDDDRSEVLDSTSSVISDNF